MKFKDTFPFVFQTLLIIIIAIFGFIGFYFGNFAEVIQTKVYWFIGPIVIVTLLTNVSFMRIAVIGIVAIFDYIFQKTKVDIYIYRETKPYSKSIVFERNLLHSNQMFYLIIMEQKGKKFTFISPKYIHFSKNKKYKVKYGKHSKIFLHQEKIGL